MALCHKKYSGISEVKLPQVGSVGTSRRKAEPETVPTENTAATTTANNYVDCQDTFAVQTTLLQTAICVISNPLYPERETKVRVLLDQGSQRSYITSQLKEKLNLPVLGKENMIIKTFGAGSNEDSITVCDVAGMKIKNPKSGFSIDLNLLTVPLICSPLQGQAVKWAKENYPHLENLDLAEEYTDKSELEVSVLLGADDIWKVIKGEVRRGETPDSPTAINTELGWVLSGPVGNMPKTKLSSVNLTATHVLKVQSQTETVIKFEDNVLDQQVYKLWDLETIGIIDNDSVHDEFLRNLKFENKRYSVSLPFRRHHDVLPDNFDLCVNRLDSLLKRLKKKPELFEEYDRVIKGQVKENIVEKFIPTPENPDTGKIHYLSHHPFVRKDALTTKVRIVYDGSAKQSVNTPSLNNCLETGPLLVPMIFDILLRFRCYKIPLVADVPQAFHQICVNREDVDYLRFLWVDDIHSDYPKLIFLRFFRVIFGLNCSPFLLSGTLQHHISQYRSEDPQLVAKLLKSIYVDDLVSGANSVPEAFRLYLKSNLCLSDARFYLRKWASSSEELMRLNDEYSTEKQIHLPNERVVSEDQSTYTKSHTNWT